MDIDLRQLLLDMVAEADRLHTRLTASGDIYEGYAPRLAEVNERHARRLEAIFIQVGWPGRSIAGTDGEEAAWRITQHAISLPDFQYHALMHLRAAVTSGEATPAQAAFLEDKIRFLEGRPQRYGTQFDWDERGELSPWTLEEPDRVDDLRREVGLEPLSVRMAELRSEEGADHRPKDLRARRREFEEWARSVGWR